MSFDFPFIRLFGVRLFCYYLYFNNNFQFVIKNTVCDENGRYIICELELSNERIMVTNLYGLNTDNTLLLESFIDDIDNFNDKPLIC